MKKGWKRIASMLGLLMSGVAMFAFVGCADSAEKPKDEKPQDEKAQIDYEQYKDKHYIDIAAWGFPTLEYDEQNGYDTEANNAFAQDMKEAGFTIVNHAGRSNLCPGVHGSAEEVEGLISQRIELFEQNGLKSAVYCSNYLKGGVDGRGAAWWDFDLTGMPDFSDSEGFYGLLVWDEPYPEVMTKLASYAEMFNETYSGTDAVFMVNLYPSYAGIFSSGGYSDYLKNYCETVLSVVDGTKYLSVDSYAIRADKQLETYLLYDIAMVKKYSLEYGALSHICLQSSMTSTKNRIPEQSEYSVQAYAALALGMDSISWYTYITPEEDGYGDGSAPVDQDGTKNAAYESLKKVNNDIAAFGYAYKCFDWKGVVLNPVTQMSAMNLILKNRELIDYVYTADDLNTISSIESEQDYMMGVMEDENGDEGFLLVNYCSLADARDSSIDIQFTEADSVMIWRNGEKQTVSLENNSITLTLAQGEGVFMVPVRK